MSILFEIKYNVYEDKKSEYLKLIEKIKDYYSKDGVEKYMVFEDEKNNNEMTELFIFSTEADFEKFEENSNEQINDLLSELLTNFTVDKKIKYRTKREI